MREVINTILYINRTGCQWDMLPHDLLPKSTVYDYFAQWRDDGTWQRMMDSLRAQVRVAAGREAAPIRRQHRQSNGENNGNGRHARLRRRQENHRPQATYPGGCHGVADRGGGDSAAVDDAAAAPLVLQSLTQDKAPRLEVVWADTKYHNHELNAWRENFQPNWRLEIVSRPPGTKGFALCCPGDGSSNARLLGMEDAAGIAKTTKDGQTLVSPWRCTAISLMLRRLAPAEPRPASTIGPPREIDVFSGKVSE